MEGSQEGSLIKGKYAPEIGNIAQRIEDFRRILEVLLEKEKANTLSPEEADALATLKSVVEQINSEILEKTQF